MKCKSVTFTEFVKDNIRIFDLVTKVNDKNLVKSSDLKDKTKVGVTRLRIIGRHVIPSMHDILKEGEILHLFLALHAMCNISDTALVFVSNVRYTFVYNIYTYSITVKMYVTVTKYCIVHMYIYFIYIYTSLSQRHQQFLQMNSEVSMGDGLLAGIL